MMRTSDLIKSAKFEPLEDRLLLSTTDFSAGLTGGASVYNGHDLYVYLYFTATSDNGSYDSIFMEFGGSDPHVTIPAASINQYVFKTDTKQPAYLQYKLRNFVSDNTSKIGYLLYNVNPGHSYDIIAIKIHTDGDASLANKTVQLTWRAETCNTSGTGMHVYETGTYDFTVLPVPDPVTAIFTAPAPAIPSLSSSDPAAVTWESNMRKYGHMHSNPAEIASNGTGVETGVWYYDGERVMYQIQDYLGDDTFEDAAEGLEVIYRDRLILSYNPPTIGQGWRNFGEGIAIDWFREQDQLSWNALVGMDDNGVYRNGAINHNYCRETAYALDTALCRKEIGAGNASTDAHISQLVDLNLEMIDQWIVSKKVPSAEYIQPFYFALTSEALIKYYEDTKAAGAPDNRIPPAIKALTDWMWDETFLPSSNTFIQSRYDPYNPATRWNWSSGTAYKPAPDLNLLIAPMFAWLYHTYGDSIYQERGDTVFAAGVAGAWLDGGKQFSQSYRWSFDYVYWRQAVADPADVTAPMVSNLNDRVGPSGEQIIKWQTGERADGLIEYGVTRDYGMSSRLVSYFTTQHSINLSGLVAGQNYHYRIKSTDPSGNVSYSVDRTFVAEASNSLAPQISQLHVSAKTGYDFAVSFVTDEDTDAKIELGSTTSYGTTVTDTVLTRVHSLSKTISAAGGTMWHYRITVKDSAGNVTVAPDMLFNVKGVNDTTTPSVMLSAVGSQLSGTISLSATATDDRGIAGISFMLGNTLLGEAWTAPYTMTFDTHELADGYYDLTAVARDVSNLQATSASQRVLVLNHSRGDVNCDDLINGQDILPFLGGLSIPSAAAVTADMNGDGILNGQDIYPFLQALACSTPGQKLV